MIGHFKIVLFFKDDDRESHAQDTTNQNVLQDQGGKEWLQLDNFLMERKKSLLFMLGARPPAYGKQCDDSGCLLYWFAPTLQHKKIQLRRLLMPGKSTGIRSVEAIDTIFRLRQTETA